MHRKAYASSEICKRRAKDVKQAGNLSDGTGIPAK